MGYKIREWTDHTSIQNLFKHKNLRGRLERWFVTLQNYKIRFEYIPGKRNTAADALSRNIVSQEEVNSVAYTLQELTTLNRELLYSEQREDKNWKQVIEHLKSNSSSDTLKLPRKIKLTEFQMHNGLLYRNAEITCEEVSREKVKQLYPEN